MKAKRVWAVLLAATMVIGSTIGVSAATTDETDGTGTTITGSGKVDYVNTTVYSVGLPTDAGMDLTVDPQGLSALADSSSATAADLADAAGKITCNQIVPITNAGSVPVKVTVSMSFTGNATVKSSIDDVNAGTNTNVLLYAVPSAVDTKDADGYQASNTGIVIEGTADSPTAISFILPAAGYVYQKNDSGEPSYVRDTSDVHGTALEFAGLVNKNADWSSYSGTSATNTIGLKAVFTFTHTFSDEADKTDGTPYAMMTLAQSVNTVEVENGPQVSISDDGLITISNLTADQNYTNLAITMDGTALTLSKIGAFDITAWDKTNGGTLTYQFSSAALTTLQAGHDVVATVALSDGTTKSATKHFGTAQTSAD
jgi:hypothetical protein